MPVTLYTICFNFDLYLNRITVQTDHRVLKPEIPYHLIACNSVTFFPSAPAEFSNPYQVKGLFGDVITFCTGLDCDSLVIGIEWWLNKKVILLFGFIVEDTST